MKKRTVLLCLMLSVLTLFAGCSNKQQASSYTQTDITMEQLAEKMDAGETFTLLVERDGCDFCEAMNAYIEETKADHPGTAVYRLDTSDFELYREQEGDMTLISETDQGKAFLERFPYFLYTPAIYHIVNGTPEDAGLGYDESNHTVSVWDTGSTIDWNASKPVDVWEFLEANTNQTAQ